MKLRLKVLINILIILFLANGIWIVYDIRKEIQFNKQLVRQELKINDQILLDIYRKLNKLDENIINLPNKIQTEKNKIEYKLRQSVVVIYNKTVEALGSGVTIKYKDKFYILSAGHMINDKEDILTFGENGREIGEVEIIKHAYTTPEEDENGDFTKGKDLILLQPKNKNLRPNFYVELADFEAEAPTEVYIVGNSAGIEDVLCEGRIIKYVNNFVYYINHTYYGNSGGGLFSKDGKLLGIVSHMYPINYNPSIPSYMIYGAVRLNQIKEFLKDIE